MYVCGIGKCFEVKMADTKATISLSIVEHVCVGGAPHPQTISFTAYLYHAEMEKVTGTDNYHKESSVSLVSFTHITCMHSHDIPDIHPLTATICFIFLC